MNQREKTIYRVTIMESIVNAGLFILKLVAGIPGRNSTLIENKIHPHSLQR